MRKLRLVLLLPIIVGCSHKIHEGVEATTEKKDSTQIHIIDSVRWETKTQIRDSVKMRDSIVIRVDSEGNEIGRSEWHWRDQYREVRDSVLFYKQLCDSLTRMTSKKDSVIIHDIEYRDKPLTKWQSFKQEVGGIAIGISVAAILGLLFWLYTKIRKPP